MQRHRVKPADKGGTVVVWSRDLYNQEANRQLSDNRFYQRLNRDPSQDYQKIVKDTVNDMIAICALPPTAQHLVVTTPRTSQFYMLPTIHKPDNPGRPIVSACSCPTENISAYLDEVMAPFVKNLPTYVIPTTLFRFLIRSILMNPMLVLISCLPWTLSLCTQSSLTMVD